MGDSEVHSEVHSSDTEEIVRRMPAEERDQMERAPAPTTPNGTPLPRGPPPPRPVQEQRWISHIISAAVGQALLEQGVYLQEALTYLPGNWQYLDAITISISPMTPAASYHPNVLSFDEDPIPEEAEAEHPTEDAEVDEATSNPTVAPTTASTAATGLAAGSATTTGAGASWPSTSAEAKPKTRKRGPYTLQVSRKFCLVCDPNLRSLSALSRPGGHAHLSSELFRIHRLFHMCRELMHKVLLAAVWLRTATMTDLLNKSLTEYSAVIVFENGDAIVCYKQIPHLARYSTWQWTPSAGGLPQSLIVEMILLLLLLHRLYFLHHTHGLHVRAHEASLSYKKYYPAVILDSGWWTTSSTDEQCTADAEAQSADHHYSRYAAHPLSGTHAEGLSFATSSRRCKWHLHLQARWSSFRKRFCDSSAGPIIIKSSRVGPKSDRARGTTPRTRTVIGIFLVVLWSMFVPSQAAGTDVRVDVDPTRTSGANLAKHVGYREAQQPIHNHELNSCAKRTYRRAYARACRDGGAFYRGQWRVHQWFRPVAIQTKQLSGARRPSTPRTSLRILTWNAGGLHSQVFRELETYLEDSAIDICMIQETKWSFDGNWSTPGFHYLHTAGEAKEDKVGGLLVAISTKIVSHSKDIQFHAVHPGRIFHVRVNRKQPLDILNLYQYTANDNKLTPERRSKFLRQLRHTLQGLPTRHTLIMGGDLNTTCTPLDKVCGKWVMPSSDAHNKDPEDLMAILSVHALTVLNTWNRPSHGQLETFTFGQLTSQIDYIVTRQDQATHSAKQAQVVYPFPVAAWREGAKHHPVLCQITIPDYRWPKATTSTIPKVDTQQLILDLRSKEPPTALQHLRAEVHQGIQQQKWSTLQQLEHGMLQVAHDHYPLRHQQAEERPEHQQLAHCARRMWALFRDMRAHPFSAQGVFKAWTQWTKFVQAHREHKQRAKLRSKARKHDLLAKAQEAASQGNMHQVWLVVKTLAPKSKRKPLQLRRNGHMLTPEAELDWIIEEFGARYGARQAPSTSIAREHPPLQIQECEVWHQLERLPLRKAVPHTAAPSVIWKACSTEITPFITHQVNQAWSQDELIIEQDWADATVALLPKPQSKNDTPKSWRPIGIQHPLGKGIMGIVISRAKLQIHQLVQAYPQTAYVPHRSTHTALKRVYSHCSYVRQQAALHRLTPHQQQAGANKVSSSGGLQISMDLSSAFDLVSWTSIKQALELAHVDPSVQEILLLWLSQVRYIFRHKEHEKDIWPSWGLRQGCVGSPVLWAVFTALLNQAIDLRLQEQWCRDHATLYADDTHLRWTFSTIAEFDQVMNELRCTFAVFRRLGMQVNNEKTKAILSAEYLGLIISYTNFEKQSVKHRVTKANHRRWALAAYHQGHQPPRPPHRDPLLFTLAKTVLKQQEELQVLRQDTAFVLYLRPGENSVLSHLYQTAVRFKTKLESDPQWKLGQFPLRMVLTVALFTELVTRLNQVLASQDRLKQVTDQGWRNEAGWRFQRWNPTLRHLEMDTAKDPIPDDQLLDHLATALQCLKHPIVNRFRCKRKMTETMTTQATFVMDISMRSQCSTTLWDTMRILQNNAVFQLVGMTYKTEGLGRSPVEQQIRDLLYGQRRQ
ncbi:Pol [Symbiodinium sp. CCMP2592]|nr:Pol [Symbiodinium sp. CCMP2592]